MAQFSAGALRDGQTVNAPASLPKTAEEIDGAIARVETRLNAIRLKVAAPKTTETAAVAGLAATPDELAERGQLLQQWVIALNQHGRHLRSLKEIRRLNQERAAEQEAWRGFAQAPTVVMAEQLTDTVSARRLELRTAQMVLSILEGEISRYAARLNESDKQLRLAKDQAERGTVQDSHREWLVQLAQLRKEADEASVWEDRLWATEQRSLRQLRAKQRHYEQLLEGLRQWKTLMEQSLSALSDQVLRQALRTEDTRLTSAERNSAKFIHTTLQERAWAELRAVGALVFTEDLSTRLHAELSEQVARISLVGRLNSVLEDLGAVFRRIWSTELYIAEDSDHAGIRIAFPQRDIHLDSIRPLEIKVVNSPATRAPDHHCLKGALHACDSRRA